MDEIRHIERFASADEEAAAESFVYLSTRLRPILDRHLSNLVERPQDREDIVQSVLAKIWARRAQFAPQSVGGWYSFAATAAWRAGIDFQRGEQPPILLDDMDLPESDARRIESIVTLTGSATRLYEVADEVWLGTAPNLSTKARAQRLLAAQLFYLHGCSFEQTRDLVSSTRTLNLTELEDWLMEPSTLRSLAYHHLYRSNEELWRMLFGKEGIYGSADGLTPDQRDIVRLHVRNGMSKDRIVRILKLRSTSVVDDTLHICRINYPFPDFARELKLVLRRNPDLLTDKRIWKRLVFQYSIADELPQLHILERIAPAAEVFGVPLTPPMLTAWLSVGRLFDQLERHVRKEESLEYC